MGKSPGKWIKGILFGKKTSKSNLSKKGELSKSASKNPERVSSEEPISTLIVDAPLIPNEVPGTVVDTIDNSSFDEVGGSKLANDAPVSSSTKQDGDMPSDPGQPNGSEDIRLEQAATVVQASFRTYQARRAFQTLKGVIRLQAIVRGRLVRRQAVATLFCVQSIVKFQAITRGHMVRRSNIGSGQCRRQSSVAKDAKHMNSCETKYGPADNLLKNAFIYELLSSSPTAMPLRLLYGPGEPNSAWDWLLRWSISKVWAPYSKQKAICDSKLQTVKTVQIQPKRNDSRVRSATVRNDPNLANAETEKLKQKGRRLSDQSVKSEHPRTENNKVKHAMKKNAKLTDEISDQAETDVEKPKGYLRKLLKNPSPNLSKKTSNTPIDRPMEDLAEAGECNDVKSSLESPEMSPTNQLTTHLGPEKHPKLYSDNSQDIPPVDKDFKDDHMSSENYKARRRYSLPPEYVDHDETPERMTRVPSYMARTASSKAKVKVHVSQRIGQEAVDKNGLTRRHSLPSSTNGKPSLSPRVQRLVQANGREGIKIDRSLSSSRDNTDKVIQADWKR